MVHTITLFALTLFAIVPPAASRMRLTLAPRTDHDTRDEELVVIDVLQMLEIDPEKIDPEEVDPEEVEELVDIEPLLEDFAVAWIEPPAASQRISIASHSPDELAVQLSTVVSPSERLPSTLSSETTANETGDGSGDAPTESETAPGSGEMGGRAQRRIEFCTPEVDYAINKSLLWLARHQRSDGGWSFEHHVGQCRGRCPHPGTKRGARVAATGLALLPFLGAGQSPEEGEYREVVAAGIEYLINNLSRNGSLWQPEGRMYGHAIATLALCECYGVMTQSPRAGDDTRREVDVERLRRAATAAASFIVEAQAADGGWRYMPRQRGDTSVVGWQITALKSAADAGLGESRPTLNAASAFLDSVQLETAGDPAYGIVGIRYAYKPEKRMRSNATTAIGLTCRIYMGVSPMNPGMEIAVNRIAAGGPIPGDMYYNFYANQVMFQHGGPPWKTWNEQLNQQLAATQQTRGHLEGSWYFGNADHGGIAGGRLYATAMACLCLEESFRHLPVFRKSAQLRFEERLANMQQADLEEDKMEGDNREEREQEGNNIP